MFHVSITISFLITVCIALREKRTFSGTVHVNENWTVVVVVVYYVVVVVSIRSSCIYGFEVGLIRKPAKRIDGEAVW